MIDKSDKSKSIPNYERYLITPDGDIWNTLRGVKKTYHLTQVGPASCKKSYYKVNLADSNMVYRSFYVHRLLATVHIENPDNLPYVDHIDQDSTNNTIENLRWATHQTNMKVI